MVSRLIILFISMSFLTSCSLFEEDLFDPGATRNPIQISGDVSFADSNLVDQAKFLHTRLQNLTQKGIMIGQQDPYTGRLGQFDFETPIEERLAVNLDSDFASLTNDLPAVMGIDFEFLDFNDLATTSESELRNLNFLKQSIKKAYQKGVIITLSWHIINPITKGNSFDLTGQPVAKMLEGGANRADFINLLERISVFFNDLKDDNGNPIPVLFRPWHEMNGDFFYWGEGLRTAQEFKQLYQDTVTILTNNFNVHNLLYVYSPNWVSSRSEYLRNYPGDDYVDVLGVDVYDFRNGNFLNSAIDNLQIVESIAKEKNMLFALTETGLRNLPINNWWTDRFYKAIRASSITYAMIWRNDTFDQFYVPYEGHPSADDFKAFVAKDDMLLNSDTQ